VTEKELGEALLHLDAAAGPLPPDPRALTGSILDRDRRKVRLWAVLSVGSWILAAGLVLFILVMFGLLFPLQAKLQQEAKQPTGRVAPAERERMQQEADVAFKMGSVLITLSVGVLSLAALSTVFLVLASRRATLRQVNATLVDVSDQLRQLRQALKS
jgi:flagellar basal body-associated protein FliL